MLEANTPCANSSDNSKAGLNESCFFFVNTKAFPVLFAGDVTHAFVKTLFVIAGTQDRVVLIQGTAEGLIKVHSTIVEKVYDFPVPKDLAAIIGDRAKQVPSMHSLLIFLNNRFCCAQPKRRSRETKIQFFSKQSLCRTLSNQNRAFYPTLIM